MCSRHRTIARERQYDDTAMGLLDDIRTLMWGDTPPRSLDDLHLILEEAFDAGDLDTFARDLAVDVLEDEWRWFLRVRPPPKEIATSELHALALDAQNVHTGAVNRQTSTTLALLLDTPVPPRQDTMAEVREVWKGRKGRADVIKDIDRWYSTSECREVDDWLYERALDGLWARIWDSDHKAALVERLWEECSDAVGVCCEGHLSRLANVLVGFDDEAKPEVSVGELLQQKIAAIAELDLSIEDKVGHAWAVFDELAIPMDQRIEWVDAL